MKPGLNILSLKAVQCLILSSVLKNTSVDTRPKCQISHIHSQTTYLVVELAVHRLALSIDQFKGVRSVSVHMTVAIGNPSITEQERHLYVYIKQHERDIPQEQEKAKLAIFCIHTWCSDSGRRLQKSQTISGSFRWVCGLRFWEWMKDGNYKHRYHVNIRMGLMVQHLRLRMGCDFYQKRIPDKEDGGVVSCKIPIALISVELHCKATRISDSIWWPGLTRYKQTGFSLKF